MKNIINHKMELKNKKPTSWRYITINDYLQIREIVEDDSLQEYDKEVKLIALINGISEDEVWNLPINEFRILQVEKTWMSEFKLNENAKFSKITINQKKYNIDTNLQNFSVAQYIDFQTLWPQKAKNPKIMNNILACFIIPEGCSYSEGYDIAELVNIIGDNIDILTANEILFFFLKQYLISMRATVNYLNWQMAKMKRISKNKKQVEKAEQEWQKMKDIMLAQMKSSARHPSTLAGLHL